MQENLNHNANMLKGCFKALNHMFCPCVCHSTQWNYLFTLNEKKKNASNEISSKRLEDAHKMLISLKP